jgi:hypothetical protein
MLPTGAKLRPPRTDGQGHHEPPEPFGIVTTGHTGQESRGIGPEKGPELEGVSSTPLGPWLVFGPDSGKSVDRLSPDNRPKTAGARLTCGTVHQTPHHVPNGVRGPLELGCVQGVHYFTDPSRKSPPEGFGQVFGRFLSAIFGPRERFT